MMMTKKRLRSRRTLSLILALLLCVSVLAVPTAASDIADRFDETDWHLGLNDRGTVYSLLFHRNGTFSYFGWKGLDHGTGEWKYSDGLLRLKLSFAGLGWQSYKPDGDSFYGESYMADSGLFTPDLTPASTSTYSELYSKWYNDIRVNVDGKTVKWTDAKPYINAQNRLMVPLRAAAEAMGLEVSWDARNKTAVFTGTRSSLYERYELKVYFPVGSKSFKVEYRFAGHSSLICEESVEMDTSAVNLNGRVYAPIRYLAETFGYTVTWDGVISRSANLSVNYDIDNLPPAPTKKLADGKYKVRIYRDGLTKVNGGVAAYAEIVEGSIIDGTSITVYDAVDALTLLFTDKTDIVVDSWHGYGLESRYSQSTERFLHFSDIRNFFEQVYCNSEIVSIEIKDGELVTVNIDYHS